MVGCKVTKKSATNKKISIFLLKMSEKTIRRQCRYMLEPRMT